MNRGTVFFVAIMTTSTLFAQNGIERAMAEIEAHNTTLKAMAKSVEAQKRANHADNALADPEVGVNKLWGDPSSIGNRTDISVSQEFELKNYSRCWTSKGKVIGRCLDKIRMKRFLWKFSKFYNFLMSSVLKFVLTTVTENSSCNQKSILITD